MRTVDGIDELLGLVGVELGASDWHAIDQERVDLFADATGDHQWIHVDPERAAAGPFGGTIAHGYLTLSLLPRLLSQLLRIADALMGVNYGSDRIRFTCPVPVGSRVRLHAQLLHSEPKADGRLNRIGVRMEIEG